MTWCIYVPVLVLDNSLLNCLQEIMAVELSLGNREHTSITVGAATCMQQSFVCSESGLDKYNTGLHYADIRTYADSVKADMSLIMYCKYEHRQVHPLLHT